MARLFYLPRSVELPAWQASRRFTLLGCFSGLGEVSAFFAAADSLVRPQTFENEFRSGCLHARIVLWAHAERRSMIKQSLHFFQLGEIFGCLCGGSNFQLAAHLEPLHYGLKVRVLEIFRECLANGGANQLARDGVGSAQLSFVFELEFSSH